MVTATIDMGGAIAGVTTELRTLKTEVWGPTLANLEFIAGILAVGGDLGNLPSSITPLNDATITNITNTMPSPDEYANGLLGSINTFGAGTPEIEFDQLALVHQGEMIIPEADASLLRSGDVTIGTEFPTLDNSDVVAAIGVLTQVLADSQEDLIELGEQQVEVSRDMVDINTSTSIAGTTGII